MPPKGEVTELVTGSESGPARSRNGKAAKPRPDKTPEKTPLAAAFTPKLVSSVPDRMPERAVAPDSPERFINRELSWLDFNHRVLEEAENVRHPLLERLRFLSISASNLDEFYSVRVAALVGQVKAGATQISADGRTPGQQLTEIKVRAESLLADQQRILRELLVLLREARLELCSSDRLTEADKTWLQAWFMERVFPVVTPL